MKKTQEIFCPREDQEQEQFFAMAQMILTPEQWELLFHVPNGEYRPISTAKRLKRIGTKRGIPDIIFDEPLGGYHGLRIEMKRRTGGALTQEQKTKLSLLRDRGYMAEVCRGCDEAFALLQKYLGLNKESD